MPLQLEDLAALDAPAPAAGGQPLLLPVESIDEDPDQPRREFDAEALQQLADTIRERGVRQPISVRPNPALADRWLLNFGARRLRASKLAGLDIVPAFVDATADNYDQVIENEQREGLKPLELALFVQKRLAQGDNQAGIAKRLGKSRQWVTFATALIDAPDWLLQAYREGRCRGMSELYEMRRLHAGHAAAVETWVSQEPVISRDRVADLKAVLARSPDATPDVDADSPARRRGHEAPQPGQLGSSSLTSPSQARPGKRARAGKLLHVEFEGQAYHLVVSIAPEEPEHVYLRPLNGGARRLARAASLTVRGFVDG